jgi:hypothetical protein
MSDAPNPKPSLADKRGYGSVASLYTAFSSDFARFALNHCLGEGLTRVCDPFSGMGTVGEAARDLPVHLLLNDLNPFATLSSIFRTSQSLQLNKAIDRVAALEFGASATERGVFDQAIIELGGEREAVPSAVHGPISSADRELFLGAHLVSLIRIETHRRLRGSNPTWTKRSADQPLESDALHHARRIVIEATRRYADQLRPINSRLTADYGCSSVINIAAKDDRTFDAIVTSPPYPNRTDYIRHYLPATELLLKGNSEAERELREVQIGTPLIRSEISHVELPISVDAMIEKVRNHKSYASERYYAKGFYYYFSDMDSAFRRLSDILRPGGLLIFVVQDAYYKEVRLPVADLLIDVARMSNLQFVGRKDFLVKQTLSRLSAKARKSAPVRSAFESVVCLKKPNK